MGYTHYWQQRRNFTDDEWASIVRRFGNYCKMVGEHSKHKDFGEGWTCTVLGNGSGDVGSVPIVNDEMIVFNGQGAQSHETMVLTKLKREKIEWENEVEYHKGAFGFCKTARKSYDASVVRLLKIAKHEAYDAIFLSSDGGDEHVFGACSGSIERYYKDAFEPHVHSAVVALFHELSSAYTEEYCEPLAVAKSKETPNVSRLVQNDDFSDNWEVCIANAMYLNGGSSEPLKVVKSEGGVE